jgi:hypothetical protein
VGAGSLCQCGALKGAANRYGYPLPFSVERRELAASWEAWESVCTSAVCLCGLRLAASGGNGDGDGDGRWRWSWARAVRAWGHRHTAARRGRNYTSAVCICLPQNAYRQPNQTAALLVRVHISMREPTFSHLKIMITALLLLCV